GPEPDLVERLAADEVVSSLLLLHGLHPLPPEERAARALRALADRGGPATRGVEIVAVDEGTLRMRVTGPADTAAARAALATRAVEEAAPELSVAVEGLPPRPP